MLGGFQGLNVCQPGGELLTRGHSRGGWKWIPWWSLGLEPESLWHFLPETGSAATSLIIIWRGAFVSLEAEDWVNSIDVHYHREKLFCMNVPGMPVNHVDPSSPQKISQLVAGSWGDQGAFRVLATWSPQEELFAFQCLCKNKAVFLCHSVHRHSELFGSQLAALCFWAEQLILSPSLFRLEQLTSCHRKWVLKCLVCGKMALPSLPC